METQEVEKRVRYYALDKRVIVVAIEGEIKDWAAYIGTVKGNRHSEEWYEVRRHGTKLPKAVAEILFPDFKKLKWRF